MATFYCEECNQLLDEKNFYYSNNLQKYPKGRLNICKKCLTKDINNYNPETYLWILQECDVPYIPEEWNKLLYYCDKNKSELNGMTILGRYLAKMKLKAFMNWRWADTQYLIEIKNKKIIRERSEKLNNGNILL